jgi:TANFOR domain-containing protein
VQGSASLIPPYALRLSDYATSTSDRMVMNVLLADVTKAELHVRFRISIVGQNVKLETKPEYIGSPITIQGGIPLRLTNIELAEYFDPNHLNFSGISKNDFLKTGFLPEGFYQFCFEVYEYNRGVKISNTICAPAWLILNDPPLINLPMNGSKLKPLSPQNVILQWTPRHTGSPNAAFTTEYEVKVVEVWPANRNPNDAILTQPTIYEATTNSTTLVYGPDATQLEPGRTYAFRVQAKAVTAAEQLDLFKNNGYSETVSFVYGDACDPPLNIVAQAETPSRITLQWDAATSQTGYTVQYRVKGQTDANWYSATSLLPSAEISGLQPNTTYEYEVMSTCGSFESTFGNVATITTPDISKQGYVCGVAPGDFNLDPSQLLPILKVGDIVNAGDFDVTITKVSGADGVFTGEGAVVVPFLNQVKGKVAFENITVNNDKRMVNGFMNITGGGVEIVPSGVLNAMDQLSQAMNIADSALNIARQYVTPSPDPNTFVADTLITVAGGINKVYKDVATGNIIVVDNSGKATAIPPGKDIALVDNNGKGVIVNKQGGVTSTTAALAAASAKREYNLSLTFAKAANSRLGFDEQKLDPLKGNYEKLSEAYFVSWKAVTTSAVDAVQATYNGKGLDPSKIKFEQDGNAITPAVSGNTFSLPVNAVAAETPSSIIAKTSTDGKEQILGKLNVVAYADKPMKLQIVKVNNANFTADAAAVKLQLDQVYAHANVTWDVTVTPQSLQVSGLANPFDDGGSGLLSNYTGDMKTVINAAGELLDDTYYLFLIDQPASGDKLGYMPRSKRAGFIFTGPHCKDSTRVINTMAHELGHGAFTLKHTFAEYTSIPQGSTDNLMDYNNGTQLWKYQWDQVHNPAIVLGLFESDEAGEMVGIGIIPDELRNADRSISCISPAGKLVLLPPSSSSVVFYNSFSNYESSYPVTGTLYSFKTDQGEFLPKFSSGGTFAGYYHAEKQTPFQNWHPTEEQTRVKAYSNALMLIPCDNKANLIDFFIENVALDDFKEVKFVSERDFPLSPFTSNKEIKRKAYTYGYQDKFGDPGYYVASPSCNSKAILPNLKSLYLRLVYQGEMSFFDNNYIAGQEPQAVELKQLKGSNEVEYEYRYLEILREYLEKKIPETKQLLEGLSEKSSSYTWWQIVNRFTYEDLSKLTLAQRVVLLRLGTRETIYGDTEHRVKNLIITTPDYDQKAMLDSLIKTKDYGGSNILLKGLIRDWGGLDGADFGQVIEVICKWVQTSSPAPSTFSLDNAIAQNKIIHFKPGFWFGDFLTERITDTGKLYFKTTGLSNSTSIEVGPYEYVYIRFDEDFKIGGVLIREGQALRFPSLYAYLLFNNENTSRLVQGGQLALDVALFATGVGEIRTAISAGKLGWRTYKAIVDVGLSVTDFTIRNSLQTKADQSKELQSFLGSWSEFMVYYSVLSISSDILSGIASNLRKQADDIVKKGYVVNDAGSTITLSEAEKQDILQTVVNVEEKIGVNLTGADEVGKYTTKIRWGIQDIEVRPFEKGYWGKRVAQSDPRVDAFELKINPNNESFYLPHPEGGFVQYENIVKTTVQDGKLIMDQSSIYHVLDKPEFLTTKSVIEPAQRQLAAAKAAGYKVEWLVSDEKAVQQLTQYFKEKNIDITVTLLRE